MFFEWFTKTMEGKTPDSVANSISELVYNPDEGITFPASYRRYKGIFKRDCLHWNDEKFVYY